MKISSNLGQLFILGFSGTEIPQWLKEFSECFELGGVLLFDSSPSGKPNIESPHQLKELIRSIKMLKGKPIICIDQEGGKVQRLKKNLGFRGLPSARERALMKNEDRIALLNEAYAEMADLGIDLNLAPTIDLGANAENPNIAKLHRAFSSDPEEVIRFALEELRIAKMFQVSGCLKHFPGLDSAKTDSHAQQTYVSPSNKDLKVFRCILKDLPTTPVMISHAIFSNWSSHPSTVSPFNVRKAREMSQKTLLISDDLQMHGLRETMGLEESILAAIAADIDWISLANTTINEENQMLNTVHKVEKIVKEKQELTTLCSSHIKRIQNYKLNIS